MSRERCLSDFWREDKSPDRVMELASVLQGADSIIGVMGSGVRAVWSTNGQSETVWVRKMKGGGIQTRVFLDYSPLKELRAPFSGQAVDEVIGYGAHEGGHCLWSPADPDKITKNIMASSQNTGTVLAASDENKMREIMRIGNILEDAYIDYHIAEKWPVLGEYVRWARSRIEARRPIDYSVIALDPQPPRNSMMNLWIACSLYDQPVPGRMSARVKRALNFLLSKSIEAVKEENDVARTRLSVACWEYLIKEFPDNAGQLPRRTPPPPQPKQPQQPQQPQQPDTGEDSGEGEGEGEDEQKPGDDKGEGEGDTGEEGKEGDKTEKQDEAEDDGEKVDKEGDKSDGAEDGDQGQEEGDEQSEAADEGEGESEEEGGEPMGGGTGGGQAGSGEGEEGEGEKSGDAGGGENGGEDQQLGHFGGEPDDGQGQPQDASGGEQGGDEKGAPGDLDEFDIRDLGELPAKLVEDVMDAISHEIEDLSKSVAEVINRPAQDVSAQTKKGDYDGPAAQRALDAVQPQIQEMRRLWEKQAQVKTRRIKGQYHGRLDTRSLSRVGTGDMRVYARKEILDTPDTAVGLLLDVSGSMNQYMDIVWMTGAVFGGALIRKQGINFLGLTYTGDYFDVQTTRICDRETGKLCIGHVVQGGGTPSGPALASIKVLMDRMREQRKVIIHFTDGNPDEKYSVIAAVAAARKAGYAVWCIGLRGMESTLLGQYGEGNYETISSIRELPAKVGELLNRFIG